MRKHEVKDDQVKMMLAELVQGLLTVADGGYPVVLALEVGRDRVTDCLLVLDKQNTTCFVAHIITFIHTSVHWHSV